MKIVRLTLAVIVILGGLMMGFEPSDRVYKIDIQVFEIPPIQTVTVGVLMDTGVSLTR